MELLVVSGLEVVEDAVLMERTESEARSQGL